MRVRVHVHVNVWTPGETLNLCDLNLTQAAPSNPTSATNQRSRKTLRSRHVHHDVRFDSGELPALVGLSYQGHQAQHQTQSYFHILQSSGMRALPVWAGEH